MYKFVKCYEIHLKYTKTIKIRQTAKDYINLNFVF